MKNNSLKQLAALGQSIWLGYIRRDLIASDGLRRLIEEDGLRGMTSNPAIFEKAIADSHDYDEDIRAMARKGKGAEASVAKQVHGQVAVASAKRAYQIYKDIFASARFQRVTDKGARVQRLLWASTGTTNPGYSDVKYVESLIRPDTVNTVPVDTLDAYRDHGEPKARLEQDVERAGWVLERLWELGISVNKVTQQFEDEGVDTFNKPFDNLMEALKERP